MNAEVKDIDRPKATSLTDPKNLEFTAVARQAQALAQSDLVPQAYRDKPANVMVAIELANRIGASVMAVMQSLHVIQGKPSFSSSFLIACVNSCGRFTPLRFEFSGEGDEYGCEAVAIEHKSGAECRGPKVTWTMVKAEGWLGKAGSKWKTLPTLMFPYRAAAFWVRLYAPELTLGMHTVDEQEDIAPAVTVSQTSQERPTRPRALDAVVGASAPAIEHGEAPAEAETHPTDGGTI